MPGRRGAMPGTLQPQPALLEALRSRPASSEGAPANAPNPAAPPAPPFAFGPPSAPAPPTPIGTQPAESFQAFSITSILSLLSARTSGAPTSAPGVFVNSSTRSAHGISAGNVGQRM